MLLVHIYIYKDWYKYTYLDGDPCALRENALYKKKKIKSIKKNLTYNIMHCILWKNQHADENKREEQLFQSSSFLFPGLTSSLTYSCIENSFGLFGLHTVYLRFRWLTHLIWGNMNRNAFSSKELYVILHLHKCIVYLPTKEIDSTMESGFFFKYKNFNDIEHEDELWRFTNSRQQTT